MTTPAVHAQAPAAIVRSRLTMPGPAGLLLPALVLYGALLIWPLLGVLWASVTPEGHLAPGEYVRFFSDTLFVSILRRTVLLSLATTAASLVLGFPIGVYLSQPWRRARSVVTFAIIAPMLVSAVARSYGWIIILGPQGPLSQVLAALGLKGVSGQLLYTQTGLVIASVHLLLPLMVLPIAGSLQQIDPSLERAARILGAGTLRVFCKVTLPLCVPGMTAGSVIVFCMSASAFVTPALIGGPRIPVMSYAIYQQAIELIDWPFASAMSFILLVATASVTLAYLLWAGSGARATGGPRR
jgi:putative spermidine/putrescine transport system permease protein